MRKLSQIFLLHGAAIVSLSLPISAQGEEKEGSWLDNVTGNVAVDAFYMVDWNLPEDPSATGNVPHRAFDFAHGFGLAFGILDLAYEGENFGATLNLRFGQGANRLLTGAGGDPVFQTLKQAYLTWSPSDTLTFDVGQFDTIYGAEVADSWQNLNYTRGALYYLMQPFYHTGLRVGVQASEQIGLTFLLVNGTNLNIDNNQSPHVGVQLSLSPSDKFFAALGYYTGAASSGFGFGAGENAPVTNIDDSFEQFFDLVINASLGPVSVVGNADLYISSPDAIALDKTEADTSIYWGASLALGVPLSETVGAAVRGEVLNDPDRFFGTPYDTLVTGTVTLDYKPIDHVIIRLDNRVEYANADTFFGESVIYTEDPPNPNSDIWFASTLGLVVTAAP
ncbi:MAG: porin [Myxococcales bacterium]|nr:porin [Myxococcales bacterium]